MSISTLTELKTAITDTLARSDLSSHLDNLIIEGEKHIVRRARTPEMETAFSDTISSGTLSVPTGFLGWKWVQISGNPSRHLKVRPATWIMENYPLRSSDGKPFFIGRDGSSFVFGPYPDSGYTVVGTYYARPTSVLSSANALFVQNPDIYLYAALCAAEPFLKNDKRLPIWMRLRDEEIRAANDEADDASRDTTMAMTVDFST